jgi:formiminoglutamase
MTDMTVFDVIEGASPIILGQPHGGIHVPDDLLARMNDVGKALEDTDWHITQLYDGLLDGVTVVKSNIHRYVIDCNRDPAGVSLYPGQNTTTLCPTTSFDGVDIWLDGQAPSEDEILERRVLYHAPYHKALEEQISRVKAKHGFAILYDCHSIRSNIPFLFEGELPIFSIGTNLGATCDARIEAIVKDVCFSDDAKASDFDAVLNGRFKGGWTTRHYGQPDQGVHAIQMELAQRAYMLEQAPWSYLPDVANKVRQPLSQILNQINDLARSDALQPDA